MQDAMRCAVWFRPLRMLGCLLMGKHAIETRLPDLLQEHALTQHEFALQTGFRESQVNRWVNGRHRPIRAHQERIARKFKVKPEDIWP